MEEINITIKNYRCFTDDTPFKFKLRNGFTAFVGPNNSGKSTSLKFFYELRQLWEHLRNGNRLLNLTREKIPAGQINIVDAHDQNEIYTTLNERDLFIEFDFLDYDTTSSIYHISKIELFCDRSKWRANVYYGENSTLLKDGPVSKFAHKNDLIVNSSEEIKIDCTEFFEFFRKLSNSMYIGSFRNALNQGSVRYFDLNNGTSFISEWNTWKTGNEKQKNKLIAKVTNDIKNIFRFDTLEINASAENSTLQVIINDDPYKLSEIGSGIAQFIIVLGNIAIKDPHYVFIDEPEQNLHPSLQLQFLTLIGLYSQSGVLFSTHSIGLARSASDFIYSFNQTNMVTKATELEKTPNYLQLLGELSYSSYTELGYEKVLFVEGVSDIRTVQQFLRKLKKDHKIVILPLGGNALADKNRAHELSEFKRLSPNISVLIDSEKTDKDSDPPNNRTEFYNLCIQLGFNVCMTKFRAIENYLTDEAIKRAFSSKYLPLKPYQRLEDLDISWSKNDSWKIAREMSLHDFMETDLGQFLDSL